MNLSIHTSCLLFEFSVWVLYSRVWITITKNAKIKTQKVNGFRDVQRDVFNRMQACPAGVTECDWFTYIWCSHVALLNGSAWGSAAWTCRLVNGKLKGNFVFCDLLTITMRFDWKFDRRLMKFQRTSESNKTSKSGASIDYIIIYHVNACVGLHVIGSNHSHWILVPNCWRQTLSNG